MKLWINGLFYTLKDEFEYVDKIITDKGIIKYIGSDCDLIEVNEVIDLEGNHVYPGFIDSHMHLIGLGRKLFNVNVKDLSKDEILNLVSKLSKNNKKILLEGYRDIKITKYDLDSVCNNVPVILRHNDYHSFTVNSKALELSKYEHVDGILIKDIETEKVMRLWNSYTKEELYYNTNYAIKELVKSGITSVYTDDLSYFNSYEETSDILFNVANENKFRIYELIHYDIYDNFLDNFSSNKYYKAIQIKLFYDGTLSSKTALLKKNYRNENHNGNRVNDITDFKNKIKKIRSNNHSVAIHTIGDLALEEVIDILIKYPSNNLPDRIVHGSLVNEETLVKIKGLNLTIDVQPLFRYSDKDIIDEVIEHEVLVHPFKEFYRNNIIINGSSDAPVEDFKIVESVLSISDLSRYEAVKMYTVNPGLSMNDNRGLIKVGYKADFTVLDNNLLNKNNNSFKVIKTIIDENIVYQNKEK